MNFANGHNSCPGPIPGHFIYNEKDGMFRFQKKMKQIVPDM